MAITMTLRQYLEDHDVEFDVLEHRQTASSSRTAQASHVSGNCLAKGVVLKRGDGFLLAVLPASQHVRLEEIGRWLGAPVSLATEAEIGPLFPDCDVGAVPAIGDAYGLDSVVDSSLDDEADVYFEGGDHRCLVHITGANFDRLMADAPRRHIGA